MILVIYSVNELSYDKNSFKADHLKNKLIMISISKLVLDIRSKYLQDNVLNNTLNSDKYNKIIKETENNLNIDSRYNIDYKSSQIKKKFT